MKIYYAHCIALYGTPQEERDVATLKSLGFEVINPNAPEHDAGYKSEGMPYFYAIVTECDALAFRANPDGAVPAGVAKEVGWAQAAGHPVIELPGGVIRRTLDVDETREYIREVGAR